MCQDWDETIHSFSAHFKGQASVCKFLIKCPGCDTDVNCTENILYDIVTCGLADSEIQLDHIGEKKPRHDVRGDISVHWAKEVSKRSAGHHLETQEADSTLSQYRHGKQ